MIALALDIGGANLKAADDRGRAWSVPFALWKAPHELGEQLRRVIADAEARADDARVERIVATMTAELCDCFASKREGVAHVVAALREVAAGRPLALWSTRGAFVAPEQATREPLRIAAANWHALATYLAMLYTQQRALLIDIGSTTTDIIPLDHGCVTAAGDTDSSRLRSGELVYLGARRTPLIALQPCDGHNGNRIALMNELFATTCDSGVLTGRVAENAHDCDTADGRRRTRECAAARVLRMIGADLDMLTLHDAESLAQAFERDLEQRLAAAIARVAARAGPQRIIVSGSGEALAAAAAQRALPGVTCDRLSQHIGTAASEAACAAALIHLAKTRWPQPAST